MDSLSVLIIVLPFLCYLNRIIFLLVTFCALVRSSFIQNWAIPLSDLDKPLVKVTSLLQVHLPSASADGLQVVSLFWL